VQIPLLPPFLLDASLWRILFQVMQLLTGDHGLINATAFEAYARSAVLAKSRAVKSILAFFKSLQGNVFHIENSAGRCGALTPSTCAYYSLQFRIFFKKRQGRSDVGGIIA